MSEPGNGQHDMTREEKLAFVNRFRKQQDDYFWCLAQPNILERYPGQVVVLHDRQVLGSGLGSTAAKEDARSRVEARGEKLPPEADLVLVVIPENVGLDETVVPLPIHGSPSKASAGLTGEGKA